MLKNLLSKRIARQYIVLMTMVFVVVGIMVARPVFAYTLYYNNEGSIMPAYNVSSGSGGVGAPGVTSYDWVGTGPKPTSDTSFQLLNADGTPSGFSVNNGEVVNAKTGEKAYTSVGQAQEDAANNTDEGANLIARIIGWVADKIVYAEGVVIGLLIKIFLWLIQYNDFVKSPVVSIGWSLVRDVSNLFFVLILLLISIGTILHIESYNFKRLLPKVILMAILVNFSRTICGLIIDFSQVIMMTFASVFAGTNGEGQLVAIMNIRDILKSQAVSTGVPTTFTDQAPSLVLVASYLLAVALLLVVIVVLVVMMVVIIMRTIMLWLLVVLSPLAYVLSAFPQGQRYSQQWWQEFSKYVIVGPVLAFFLWLALATASSLHTTGTSSGKIDSSVFGDGSGQSNMPALTDIGASTSGLGDVTVAGTPLTSGGTGAPNTSQSQVIQEIGGSDSMLAFIIGISMLLGGLMITQQLGVAGGQFAGQMAGRIRQAGFATAMAPLKIAGKGLGTAEKMLYGATGIGLDPRRLYHGLRGHVQAWQGRMERQGATKGFGKAKELVATEAAPGRFRRTRGFVRRAAGLGGMAMASPEDFFDNYGTFRGIAKLGKTLFKGTSIKEMEEWEQERKKRADEFARQEKLVHIGDVTEKGREQLTSETGKFMAEQLENGKDFIVTEEVKGGPPISKRMTAADFDALLGKVNKNDLRQYGLEGLIDLVDPKAGGIDKSDAAAVQKFKNAFFNYHSGKLVNEVGSYVDSTGRMQAISPAELQKAGTRYYDDEMKRRDDELDRVAKGGLTDQQIETRQSELENINQQMLKVLKSIESSGRAATSEEKAMVAELADRGERLGGHVVTDRATGLEYFGLSPTDRDHVQRITPADIIGRADTTLEESRQLQEKDELGHNTLDRLREDRRDFSNEVTMAKMSPGDRRIEQNRIAGEVKDGRTELQKEDMDRKKKAIDVPIGYEALTQMRAAEREELSKLPESMEWTEIESELFSAMQLKNVARVRALMKKAAIDYNDNEVWRSFGYSQDAKGMREFGDKELVGRLGMNRQEMLKFMDDVAYINEDKNHLDTSRMVTLENGMARWSTEAEHAASVANENLKKASRNFLQNVNRLAFGGDDSSGQYHLALSGKLTLAGIGDKELMYRLERGEFNPSTLSKIATDIAGLQDMVQRGWISQKAVDMITELAKRKSVSAAYSDLLRQAKTASK